MTISIHPARRASEDVPPGTWDGTKQDAVLATAQLRDVWERKKAGEKSGYGYSEYDSQMANAQLRAFKLTKLILRRARKQSAGEIPIMIEALGFQVDPGLEQDGFDVDVPEEAEEFPLPQPPPTAPLPPLPIPTSRPPIPPRRMRPKSAMRQMPAPEKLAPKSIPLPPSKFPAPAPPRKSPNRLSQLPPPVKLPQRRFSDEVSPKTIPRNTSPHHIPRPDSPVPRTVSPRREPEPRRRTPDIVSFPPIAPIPSRAPRELENPSPFVFERCDTPQVPDLPILNPRPSVSFHIERKTTPPLNTKRRTLTRAASFKFGEGLQSYSLARTSSLIYAELSDALKDLQRTIGAAAVEVH
jgi:hypothetical protein